MSDKIPRGPANDMAHGKAHDPELEALRQAWNSIPAPEPFRPLAEEDAATQRAVAWLQEALRAIEPAAPAGHAQPALRRQDGSARRRLALRLLPLAAAAALLTLLGLDGYRAEAEPLLPPNLAVPEPSIEVLASSRHRVELRSGPVRLTLLHPIPTPENP